MSDRATTPRAVIGEEVWRRERARPQPGDRLAAPGGLAVVQAFINTHFDLVEHWGADQLATPEAVAAWLDRRGLLGEGGTRIGPRQHRRALEFRQALRGMLEAGEPGGADVVDRLNRAVRGARLEVRFGDAAPQLVPAAASGLDRAIAVMLALIVTAAADGTWWRLKACPGHHCGWVFYDASRNNSGRWCSMAVCGGRTKAREYYRRRRARAA